MHIHYAVTSVSRIDQIIGLFSRIASLLQVSFAKETYNLIDPANRSHPIHLTLCTTTQHPARDAHELPILIILEYATQTAALQV